MSVPFYPLTLRITTVPPVAQRGNHVLILLEDGDHKFVLGSKKMYPPGIYRMVGGGVDGTETPLAAAQRELREELHISLAPEKLKQLATVRASITDQTEQSWIFTTYLFYARLRDELLMPSDDLDGVMHLSVAAYQNLLERFELLPTEIDPILHFAWHDYGQIYKPIHEIALREWKNMKEEKGKKHQPIAI